MPLPCLPLLPTQPSSSRRKTPLSLKMFRFHGDRSWHHQNFLPSRTLPPLTTVNMVWWFFFLEGLEKKPQNNSYKLMLSLIVPLKSSKNHTRQFGSKSADAFMGTSNQGCRFSLLMLLFPTARWWQEGASSQTFRADCARHHQLSWWESLFPSVWD